MPRWALYMLTGSVVAEDDMAGEWILVMGDLRRSQRSGAVVREAGDAVGLWRSEDKVYLRGG